MNNLATIIRESRLVRFLVPAGLILIVCGIFFFSINLNNQDYIRTEATVTKVEAYQETQTDDKGSHTETNYKVELKYTVDGKEYVSELDGVSKCEAGDKMTIYYDPADPNNITQSTSLIMPIAIIAAGIAALVGGVISGINAVKRYQRMKEQEREWANGK